MAVSHPRSPGWYPEPDILPGSKSTLRYWNGSHWTDRRRPVPILTSLDLSGPFGVPQSRALEGPALAAELPAPAAEVSATRDSPAGRADTIERSPHEDGRGAELPTAAGGGSGFPPVPPALGGGGRGSGDGGGGDGSTGGAGLGGRNRSRRRRTWWLVSGIAVLAALAMALVGEAMRPPSPGPRVLTDRTFVKLANNACARTMPTLRPADGGPLGSSVSPAKAAVQIDGAATGLDDLADRLAALPAAEADRPHIASWLGGWHRYDAVGHQYADFLRRHGATDKPPPMLKSGADLAKSADNFARANGLTGCLFAFAYTPDPSQF